MCDRSPCARDIAEGIDRSETRTEAISRLEDLSGEEFDTKCLREILKVLVRHLDHENVFYRRRMWAALQSLAETYPDTVADYVSGVLEAVPLDDDQRVEQLGAVLAPLLDRGIDLSGVIDRRYADELKKAQPDICRRAAVDLFCKFESYADIRTLEEIAEYETKEISDRAKAAAETILEHALSDLEVDGETIETDGDAAAIVRHVAYREPARLEDATDELFDLLGTRHADVAIVALGEIASTTGKTGRTVTDRLVDTVKIDRDPSEDPTEGTEETSLSRAEDALEALIEADRTTECSSYVISRSDQWLTADSVRLHEHALTQLRVLAERDPDKVKEHVDEIATIAGGDGEESSLATEVLNRYGQAQSDDAVSYLEQLLETHEGGSIVGHLVNAVECLQYRQTGQTRYDSLTVDEATNRALANVADAVREGQTLPIVWPAYEPRVAVLVALELALRGLDDGTDVVVFSPGGGNHWGNKGDLRDELANYGLVVSEGTPVVPLPEVIPHARIDDGSIVTMSDGQADTRVVFSKRIEEVQELDELDTVVLNLTSRTKAAYEEEIDGLLDEYPDTPFAPLYSNYTKHEFEERRAPRYGPPRDLDETDTLPRVDALEVATEGVHRRSEFPGTFASWFDRATDGHEIRVVGVDDSGLLDYLEPGYEASSELREYDEKRAAGRIFSRQLMFERLPVPADRYDDWVRSQRDGYFGPRTLTALVDKLEERADDIIGRPAVAGQLFETADALRRARDHVSDRNPLYEELTQRLRDSLDEGLRVAVFLPKATWCRAAREIVQADGVVSQADLDEERVVFVSPDSARDLRDRDRLYVVGPQRPQYAGFYVHPAVGETIVLTYRGKWRWMIERDATRFVERKNTAVPGLDYSPYATPTVKTDMLVNIEPTDESEEPAAGTGEPTQTPGTSTSGEMGRVPPRETDRAELAELFDQARQIDYQSGGSGRYDDWDRSEFVIETTDGETFSRRDRVLRRRPNPSSDEDRYHWVSPHSLREDDQIAIIDEEAFKRRWDEWLSDVYSEELGDTNTFEDLTTWHEVLTEVLSHLATMAGVDDLTHESVRRQVKRKSGDIDREPSTVWRWFESVAEADHSLDLARDPSLTIGPRRAADIDELGEQFDVDQLTGEDALRIEESMSRIRTTNMKQGHEFRLQLKEEMNALEDDGLRDDTTTYGVASVTEL